MADILVISDSHINPSQESPEELWYRLGKYCTITQPHIIIHLGDVADLSSQAWKVAARGPYSLKEETKKVSEVLDCFEEALADFNRLQKKKKKKMYKPKKYLTLGNHDVRGGVTDIEDIFSARGWSVVDYLQPLHLRGITFCHSMHKGLSDLMCTTAQELLENWHSDIVVGHGHHKDFCESYSQGLHKKITALKCPVFTVEEFDWANQTQEKWSRGFTEIDINFFNTFSFVWKDLECLYKNL